MLLESTHDSDAPWVRHLQRYGPLDQTEGVDCGPQKEKRGAGDELRHQALLAVLGSRSRLPLFLAGSFPRGKEANNKVGTDNKGDHEASHGKEDPSRPGQSTLLVQSIAPYGQKAPMHHHDHDHDHHRHTRALAKGPARHKAQTGTGTGTGTGRHARQTTYCTYLLVYQASSNPHPSDGPSGAMQALSGTTEHLCLSPHRAVASTYHQTGAPQPADEARPSGRISATATPLAISQLVPWALVYCAEVTSLS
ncbi:hypothetical protein M419DRAFT_129279 [Trichoderma reesei RUT C-30]|uniref:Uncharacterized protein n=1 Tax=Hypocrea jecorina (strain ATCC 56765 / BCRC 32924 / NRRL 11460 / Rut C-30) TaxID=1344414 RepID=A0A024SCQ7_HYPJR|nr:hypothetical protein M419DRAFT_129279 [Trichoderma reesei RUT C-30]